MGTQIQSETYFLRHCSRNSRSQSISTGRWLSYQDGKVPGNSQHEDSSTPWRGLMDRYSGQDKVKVKETILEHEVTFRHQVRELHRLYRRQRELMNAIQDNRIYKIQKRTESSQSVIFPSYLSSESAKRTWDTSHFLSSNSVLGPLDPSSSCAGQSSNVQSNGINYLGYFNEPFQFLNRPSSEKSSFNLSCHADKLERRDITANVSSGFSLNKEISQYSMPVMNGKISINRSPSGCHGNGKELNKYGLQLPDLPLQVEHKTESRKKRKLFGVEIAEEVDESSLVSLDANNLYPGSNGAESDHSEPSWLRLGSCLQNLESVGGTGALKSSAPKSELFHQSFLFVHPQTELIDGATASLDISKGKNGFTSLPDLFEFHDSSHRWKNVNLKELKSRKFFNLDSEITKEAEEKKDGHTIGKIVGFPLTEMISKTVAMDLPTDAVSKKCPPQIVANPNVPEKSLSNYISGLRNHFDLNLSIDEEESPADALPPVATVNIIRPEIDLEVPPLIESEVEHRGTKSLDKSDEPGQSLLEEAAEALLVISSALINDVASNATCHLENTSDRLHWFADVIFSHTSDEEVVPDGMDYFEFVTLHLKDVKEESYCYNVLDMEHQKAEETEISVTKRSGRGHRRGTGRKDFQKDVLPDLVSLAKQEVVEDLHTLEELIHSTGKTWKSSLSRRNGAKNSRRGMKARESIAATESYSARLPSKEKQTGRELQLRGKSFSGWGKRTRRLPRQRCSKKLSSSIQLFSST